MTMILLHNVARRIDTCTDKLPTLQLRRLHSDLTWCYKILFGSVDMDSDEFFVLSPNLQTRGHHYKLFKQRSNTRVRSIFFSERVVNI